MKKISNDNSAKIIKHIRDLKKSVDFLYTELASFENMEGRIEGLESQAKIARRQDIEIKKSIEETVNIASERTENKIEELQDQLGNQKILQVASKRYGIVEHIKKFMKRGE